MDRRAWSVMAEGGRGTGVCSARRLLLACLGLAVLSRTGAAQDDGPTLIVSNAPRVPSAKAWRVAPQPLLQVGAQGDTIELSDVRGVARLANGLIGVANAGGHEIVFLNENGTLHARNGRTGGAQGAFQDVSALGLLNTNHVWAFDPQRGVVSVFNDNGEYVREYSLAQLVAGRGVSPVGALPDGRLVVRSTAAPLGGSRRGFDSTDVYAVDLERGSNSRITRLPREDLGDPIRSRIFGAPSMVLPGDFLVYTARAEDFEIRRLDLAGQLQAIIRKRHDRQRLTDEIWNEYVRQRLASISGPPAQIEALRAQARSELDRVQRPEELPALAGLLLDREGNLWAREHDAGGVLPALWHVFDADGLWLTSVRLPARFRLHDIGPDWLLGVMRDEADVPIVTMLRLEKPA